jgi:DNA-binding transcriptional regulator LsrR (DeoR family)
MSSRADLMESRLKHAKSLSEFRAMTRPIDKAVWLVLNHAISQLRAAKDQNLSRCQVQRGLKAFCEGRVLGINGRAPYLSADLELELKKIIVEKARGLQSMTATEVRSEVRGFLPSLK